jgi:hypothetical protein
MHFNPFRNYSKMCTKMLQSYSRFHICVKTGITRIWKRALQLYIQQYSTENTLNFTDLHGLCPCSHGCWIASTRVCWIVPNLLQWYLTTRGRSKLSIPNLAPKMKLDVYEEGFLKILLLRIYFNQRFCLYLPW